MHPREINKESHYTADQIHVEQPEFDEALSNYTQLAEQHQLPKPATAADPEELHDKAMFGEYYEAAMHMGAEQRYMLSKLVKEEERSRRSFDEAFKHRPRSSRAFGSLRKGGKNDPNPVMHYIVDSMWEGIELDKYVSSAVKENVPGSDADGEAKAAYEKQVLSVISRANYLRNQHALILRIINTNFNRYTEKGFVECQAESQHYASVFRSCLTQSGSFRKRSMSAEDLDACILRADTIRGMLLTKSSVNEPVDKTAGEQVEEIRKKMVDSHSEELNQESDEERKERRRVLKPYQDKFDAVIRHDESNEFSVFRIPAALLSEENGAVIDKAQRDVMDLSALSLFALSSMCASVKLKQPDTPCAALARCFDEAAFSFSAVTQKYSSLVKAKTETILADKKLSAEEKRKELGELCAKMAELSDHHGRVCAGMVRTLELFTQITKDPLPPSQDDAYKLSLILAAKDKCLDLIPAGSELKEPGLESTQKDCMKAVQAIDDLERYSRAVITLPLRKTNADGTVDGDTESACGERYDELVSQELKSIRTAAENIVAEPQTAEGHKEKTQHDKAEQPVWQEHYTTSIYNNDGYDEKHIPGKRMSKLKSFYVGDKKHKGVGKCRAYFLRHGHVSGGKLKTAVDTHVARMLESSRLTDSDLAEAAANITESTGVISDDVLNKKLAGKKGTVLYTRLIQLKELSQKTGDREILEKAKAVRAMVGAGDVTELDLNDRYFTMYPQALKVVLMHRLIKDIGPGISDKNSREVTDRLEAAASGIEELYKKLTQTWEYRDALSKQQKAALHIDTSPVAAQIFRDSSSLASVRMESVFERRELYESHRRVTAEGLEQRITQASYAAAASEELEAVHAREQKQFEEMERAEKERRIKSNYERVLKRVKAYSEEERLRDLERKKTVKPEEQYSRAAGDAAYETLKDNIRDMLRLHYEDAGIAGQFEADEELINSAARKFAMSGGYGGAKEITQLDYSQLMEISALVSSRLSTYPAFFKKLTKKLGGGLNAEQRKYLIDRMFENRRFSIDDAVLAVQALKDRREFLDKNEYAIVYGGSRVVLPRLYNDMTKLKANADMEIRAGRRQARMEETDRSVRSACVKAGVEQPKSFYEFAADKKLSEGEISEKDLFTAYKEYMKKEWYPGVEDKDTEKTKPLKKIRDMLSASSRRESLKDKDKFKYYGLLRYGAVLSHALGTVEKKEKGKVSRVDLLNDTSREEFEENLASNVLKNLVDKEVAVRRYCAEKKIPCTPELVSSVSTLYGDIDFTKKMHKVIDGISERSAAGFERFVERRDKRINELTAGGYGMLLPIFFESPVFTEHLAADNDEEFDLFKAQYLPRAKEIVEEIERHPYVEQYLIGKKTEILVYIFSEKMKGRGSAKLLKLDDYDAQIESTVVKGKTTLGDLIRKAVTERKSVPAAGTSDEQVRIEEGNLYIMALLYDGIGAVTDKKKMEAYRERVAANTAALNSAIDLLFSEKTEGGYKYTDERREAIRASIFQNERKNLFLTEQKEYEEGCTGIVRSWFVANEEEQREQKKNDTRREKIMKTMQGVIGIRNAGREAFMHFHEQTEEIRARDAEDYRKRAEESSKDEADAYFKERLKELPEEVKKMLDTFFKAEKDALPKNGALNSFYNEILIRMSHHAMSEDPGQAALQLMQDHNCFANVRSFYQAASEFLSDHEMTKDKPLASREKAVGGLLCYYAKQILSPAYITTPDVIKKELKVLLDKDKGGGELYRILQDERGYRAVGSDGYDYSSSPLVTLDRKAFEDELAERAKHGAKLKAALKAYNDLDPDTRILCAHLLVRDANLYIPGGYLTTAFFKENVQAYARTDVILSFIKGEALSEPDYRQALLVLKDGEGLSAERFKAAVKLAGDIKGMRV